MHTLEKKISREIAETGIINRGDYLLVAVSGGVDSMGLLNILSALKEDLALTLTAAYVDHGLRPEETVGERVLVEAAAMDLGVEFCAGTVNVRAHSAEEGLSIEEAARELRYRFLQEAAYKYGCAKIVVAHTADDQAEELLLRLIRGTGRSGLAGMSQVNFRDVIRPLLHIRKAEILSYLAERNISYLEDSSNAERIFLRNRIRLDLLPYLAEHFNPAIRETLLRTVEILGAEEDLLSRLAVAVYDRVVHEKEGAEHLVIDCPALAGEELALQRRVVELVLTNLSSPVTFQQVEKILELMTRGKGGSELHLPEGLRVVKSISKVALSYPAGRTRQRGRLGQKRADFLVEITGPGSWPVPELKVNIEVSVLNAPPGKEVLFAGRADYLDMRLFDFPLQVRPPKAGDRFRPLSGPGSKKVADFLADRKLAQEDRRLVPVLLTGEVVLALLGIRIDDRYKLLADSGKVLKVQTRRL